MHAGIYRKSSRVKNNTTLPFPMKRDKRKEKSEKRAINRKEVVPSFDFPVKNIRRRNAKTIL